MRFYDVDQVKEQGDCVRFAEEVLGAKVSGGRCAAVWRGGDNPSTVTIEKNQWFDHKEKKGGDSHLLSHEYHEGSLSVVHFLPSMPLTLGSINP